MYQNPTLFPAISNRESWLQTVVIADDDTGDLITLTDTNNNPLYGVNLEIIAAEPRQHFTGYGPTPYYDDLCEPVITGSLANYLSITGLGTIQIMVPKSVMQTLRAQTYDVYLTIVPNGEDDGRQLLIGRLPVLYGGRNT